MRELDLTHEELRQAAGLWWLVAGLGVLSIVAGVLVLVKPDNSLKALAAIVGIFILLDGIVELVLAFSRTTSNRAIAALLGTLNLIIGIVLIRHPIAGVQAAAFLIGIWLIAAGVIRGFVAFESPGERLGRLLIAGVEFVFGVAIISSSHIGFATLALLVGLSFLANGVGLIVSGFVLRALKNNPPQSSTTALAT